MAKFARSRSVLSVIVSFVCVYADRDAERRVISLRKANKREVKRYGDSIE
jgi:uncharacterized DUF497 family protein